MGQLDGVPFVHTHHTGYAFKVSFIKVDSSGPLKMDILEIHSFLFIFTFVPSSTTPPTYLQFLGKHDKSNGGSAMSVWVLLNVSTVLIGVW